MSRYLFIGVCLITIGCDEKVAMPEGYYLTITRNLCAGTATTDPSFDAAVVRAHCERANYSIGTATGVVWCHAPDEHGNVIPLGKKSCAGYYSNSRQ